MSSLTIDNKALQGIISDKVKHFLGEAPEAVKLIDGGSNGKAFRCNLSDKDIVVKAFRIKGMMEKEMKKFK